MAAHGHPHPDPGRVLDAGRASRRTGGFLPIEDYAVLGDGRTVAVVGLDGQIDWWPVPTLDAPPVFGALLDPERGGYFLLRPVEEWTACRRYLEDTNVLETEYTTASGTVVVTESLNSGLAGRLPWTELARRVEGRAGRLVLRYELRPGDRFQSARPWVSRRLEGPVVHVGDQMLAMVIEGMGEIRSGSHHVAGTLELGAGERGLVAAVATDDEPLFFPTPDKIHRRIDGTVESWRSWTGHLVSEGQWAAAQRRSALALKTLLYEPSGAIAAAATTSLPEAIGGAKNWDYRYAWVRDSSFTLDALISLELHEEVQRAVTWLLRALRKTAPDLHVFYRLDGTVAGEESEVDAPGYRGSRPVRSGNGASGQRQLGTYGDLFDTVHRYVAEGHVLDPSTASLLAELADRCCDTWQSRDSGIWELGDLQHYTISKMGCWVALDRAADLGRRGQLPDYRIERWEAEAADVRAWVHEHCWSEAKAAYTFYAGTERLDAAVLLAGRTGFERGGRLASTIDAVTAELARGPLVYRYSGMEQEEGAFVACSFWLVDALARVGRMKEARRLMDEVVGLSNEVGLLSEEIDPASGHFLGNIPQGLSHLALINTAKTLDQLSSERPGRPAR